MKELSLNMLDIAENSVRAGAALTQLLLTETADTRTLEIRDDGCGMDAETVRRVTDPFYTTRTTRRVGMGLPLLRLAAEQTGGTLMVVSRPAAEYPQAHGTTVTAVFHTDHIDCVPLGMWQKRCLPSSRDIRKRISCSGISAPAFRRWSWIPAGCGRCWRMCR